MNPLELKAQTTANKGFSITKNPSKAQNSNDKKNSGDSRVGLIKKNESYPFEIWARKKIKKKKSNGVLSLSLLAKFRERYWLIMKWTVNEQGEIETKRFEYSGKNFNRRQWKTTSFALFDLSEIWELWVGVSLEFDLSLVMILMRTLKTISNKLIKYLLGVKYSLSLYSLN